MAYLSPRRGAAGAHRAGRDDGPAGGRRARPRRGGRDRRGRRAGRRGGAVRRRGGLAAPAPAVRDRPGRRPAPGRHRRRRRRPGGGRRLHRPPERLRRLPARPPAAVPPAGCRCTGSCTPRRRARGARRPGDPAVAHPVQPDHRGTAGPARGRAGRRRRPAARGQPRPAGLDDGDPRGSRGWPTATWPRSPTGAGCGRGSGWPRTCCAAVARPAGRRADGPSRRRAGRRPRPRRLGPRPPDHRGPPVGHGPDGPDRRSWARSSTSGCGSAASRACGWSTRRCCRGCRHGGPRPRR